MNGSFRNFIGEKKTGVISHDGIDRSEKDIKEFFKSLSGEIKNAGELVRKYNEYFKDTKITRSFYPHEIQRFIDAGYITKEGRKLIVVSSEIPVEDEAGSKATKVTDLAKGTVKKFKIPPSVKGGKIEEFTKTVILHMLGSEKGKLLLTGDPGTGKSRTVETVISLLKMQVITLEAPHVNEEGIINIPYISRRGNNIEEFNDTYKEGSSDFEVVNAESNIITRIKRLKPITDSEYNSFIKSNKSLQELAEKYKTVIENLGKQYTVVLFIDEFYRTGSKRIQNLFRTILNGRLGTTPIPANAYIIFASNMDNSDGSLDDIPLNHQFNQIDFDTPSKNDFFKYLADRFVDEENPETSKLQPEVYNKFEEALQDIEFGTKDETTDAGIRVSPRRWEEIIKYVNANIPVQTELAAKQLLTFVKDNMKDYRTSEVSSLLPKYLKVVKDLIKETSNIDVEKLEKLEPLEPKEWQTTLANQIETKLKLGDDRKYMPIISGAPGIGKTTVIEVVAKKYNLKKIEIDVSTLNADDSIGLVLPRTEPDGTITSEFTDPPLYTQIMSEYDDSLVPEKGYAYTHVLFLDEITRASSIKVFNSIRSLMLDKKIGSKKIPSKILILGAMNPFDVGAIELSDHMIDVVDIVSAEPNYEESMKRFTEKTYTKSYDRYIGFRISDIILDMHRSIVSLLESKVYPDGEKIMDTNIRKFYFTDGFNVFYISPREFDDMIFGSLGDIQNGLMIEGFIQDGKYTDEEIELWISTILKLVNKKYSEVLKFVAISKAKIEKASFDTMIMGVSNVIGNIEPLLIAGFKTMKKSDAVITAQQIIEGVNNDFRILLEEPTIGSIIENILDNNDADEIISDFNDAIDLEVSSRHDFEYKAVQFISLWKVMKTVDWSKYSHDITSNISTLLVVKGIIPMVEHMESDLLENKDIGGWVNKYTDDIEEMYAEADTNKFNLFL